MPPVIDVHGHTIPRLAYLRPVALGYGTPYFAGPRPPLHLTADDQIGEDVIRLT